MPRKKEDIYEFKLDYKLMEEVGILTQHIYAKLEKAIRSNPTPMDL